jgi:hypothetical protein
MKKEKEIDFEALAKRAREYAEVRDQSFVLQHNHILATLGSLAAILLVELMMHACLRTLSWEPWVLWGKDILILVLHPRCIVPVNLQALGCPVSSMKSFHFTLCKLGFCLLVCFRTVRLQAVDCSDVAH